MSWTYKLSGEAARQLRRLPRDRQQQLARALDEMQEDPLRGDVAIIQSGRFKGVLRRRVGRYRIIFSAERTNRVILVPAILLRSEKTYR